MKIGNKVYFVLEVLIIGSILWALAVISQGQPFSPGAHNTQYQTCHFTACGSDPWPVPGMFTCDPLLYAQNAKAYVSSPPVCQTYMFPSDIQAVVLNHPLASAQELAVLIVQTPSWAVNSGETLDQWLSIIRVEAGCAAGPTPVAIPSCPPVVVPTLTPTLTGVPTWTPTLLPSVVVTRTATSVCPSVTPTEVVVVRTPTCAPQPGPITVPPRPSPPVGGGCGSGQASLLLLLPLLGLIGRARL